jgi:hypothetical protein
VLADDLRRRARRRSRNSDEAQLRTDLDAAVSASFRVDRAGLAEGRGGGGGAQAGLCDFRRPRHRQNQHRAENSGAVGRAVRRPALADRAGGAHRQGGGANAGVDSRRQAGADCNRNRPRKFPKRRPLCTACSAVGRIRCISAMTATIPLPLDVLVVDEVSMVGLALLAKTVMHCRLRAADSAGRQGSVGFGGSGGGAGRSVAGAGRFSPEFRAQLASVDGEPLPRGRESPSPLVDAIVLLRHSYRFGADSGIGALAQAVNRGRSAEATTCCWAVAPTLTGMTWPIAQPCQSNWRNRWRPGLPPIWRRCGGSGARRGVCTVQPFPGLGGAASGPFRGGGAEPLCEAVLTATGD